MNDHAAHIAHVKKLLLSGKAFSTLHYQWEHRLSNKQMFGYIEEASRQIKQEERNKK